MDGGICYVEYFDILAGNINQLWIFPKMHQECNKSYMTSQNIHNKAISQNIATKSFIQRAYEAWPYGDDLYTVRPCIIYHVNFSM